MRWLQTVGLVRWGRICPKVTASIVRWCRIGLWDKPLNFRTQTDRRINARPKYLKPSSRYSIAREVQFLTMIGRLHHIVVDCPNPLALATIYSTLESRRETWRVNPLRGCLHVKINSLLTRAA